MSVTAHVGLWTVECSDFWQKVGLRHSEMPEWEGRELTPEEAEMLGRMLMQAAQMTRRGRR